MGSSVLQRPSAFEEWSPNQGNDRNFLWFKCTSCIYVIRFRSHVCCHFSVTFPCTATYIYQFKLTLQLFSPLHLFDSMVNLDKLQRTDILIFIKILGMFFFKWCITNITFAHHSLLNWKCHNFLIPCFIIPQQLINYIISNFNLWKSHFYYHEIFVGMQDQMMNNQMKLVKVCIGNAGDHLFNIDIHWIY